MAFQSLWLAAMVWQSKSQFSKECFIWNFAANRIFIHSFLAIALPWSGSWWICSNPRNTEQDMSEISVHDRASYIHTCSTHMQYTHARNWHLGAIRRVDPFSINDLCGVRKQGHLEETNTDTERENAKLCTASIACWRNLVPCSF